MCPVPLAHLTTSCYWVLEANWTCHSWACTWSWRRPWRRKQGAWALHLGSGENDRGKHCPVSVGTSQSREGKGQRVKRLPGTCFFFYLTAPRPEEYELWEFLLSGQAGFWRWWDSLLKLFFGFVLIVTIDCLVLVLIFFFRFSSFYFYLFLTFVLSVCTCPKRFSVPVHKTTFDQLSVTRVMHFTYVVSLFTVLSNNLTFSK